MSGILRLANTGAGTGRSTLQSNASNDVTFNLPDTGTDNTATILTDDLHSISTANWDGLTINITNADFNVDGGTLFVDESTNRVGIGTTSPSAKLEVRGTGDNSAVIRIQETGTTNGFEIEQSTTENRIFSSAALPLVLEAKVAPSAQPIIFRQGSSTERARIDSDGRMLIGTNTSLQAKYAGSNFQPGFQNAAVSGTGGFFRYANNNDGATLVFNKSRNTTIGNHTIVNNSETLGYLGFTGSDGTQFQTAASITGTVDGTPGTNDMPGRLMFNTTADGANIPLERMRIDSKGRIGFNSVANNARVYFGGDTEYQDGISAIGYQNAATVSSSVTGTYQAYNSYNSISATTTAASYIGYGANFNEILTGGSLSNLFGFKAESNLTGATNSYGFHSNIASGTGRWNFYAQGTARNYFAGNTLFGSNDQDAIIAGTNNGMYVTSQGVMYKSRTETTEKYQIAFINGNGEVGTIKTDGNATTYNTSSDYRLKENITPMVGAADRVKALKPCRFNFKTETDKTVDGFLAHEAQEVVPEAVTGIKDGKEMQAIDTSKLVPLLTAALQEAFIEISELKERVKNLEG